MALTQVLAYQLLQEAVDLSIVLAAIATMCIGLCGYIANDWFDRSIDQINRPGRNVFHLPWIGQRAWYLFAISGVLGMGMGAWLGPWLLTLCAGTWALLMLYARWLKGSPFMGNITISALHSVLFAMPALLAQGIDWRVLGFNGRFFLVMAGFAFATAWFREWAKDMEDLAGDRAAGLRTAAVMYPVSISKAGMAVIGLAIVLAIIIFIVGLHIPSFYGRQGVLVYYYLFLMLPMCLRSMVMLAGAQNQHDWHKLATWLKIVMFAGVISMAIK
jgi:4-hydroxybenzoate polyprenyltransferase